MDDDREFLVPGETAGAAGGHEAAGLQVARKFLDTQPLSVTVYISAARVLSLGHTIGDYM